MQKGVRYFAVIAVVLLVAVTTLPVSAASPKDPGDITLKLMEKHCTINYGCDRVYCIMFGGSCLQRIRFYCHNGSCVINRPKKY